MLTKLISGCGLGAAPQTQELRCPRCVLEALLENARFFNATRLVAAKAAESSGYSPYRCALPGDARGRAVCLANELAKPSILDLFVQVVAVQGATFIASNAVPNAWVLVQLP